MASGTPFVTTTKDIPGSERRGSTSSEGSLTNSTAHTKSSTDPEYLHASRFKVGSAAASKPAADPLKFIKVGPCNLYKSAQEQLKKAEEIKKQTAKDVRREQTEDWQSNLDNWKSSRRKQVEHIIERCVEVKRLESEDHDRTRRRPKTFSEMMEDRVGRRNGRVPITLYCEEDNNDLSDLGIGTSSTSGKSSLSEDCDNHSLASDGMELDKNHSDLDNDMGNRKSNSNAHDYDVSTTTTISSPEPEEYTYEGAIQGYKSRIISKSLAPSRYLNKVNVANNLDTKERSPDKERKHSIGSKIEDKLSAFEPKREGSVENCDDKKQLPKMDILKKRNIFEKEESNAKIAPKIANDLTNAKSVKERLSHLEKLSDDTANNPKTNDKVVINTVPIKDRLNNLEKSVPDIDKINVKLSNGDLTGIMSIKDRVQNLNTRQTPEKNPINDTVPVVPLKDRLNNFDTVKNEDTHVNNNENNETLVTYLNDTNELIDNKKLHRSLDSLDMKDFDPMEKFERIQSLENFCEDTKAKLDIDREDSGIHTEEVSSSVSQDDERCYNGNLSLASLNESSKNSEVHQVTYSKPVLEEEPAVEENNSETFFDREEEDTVKSLDQDNSIFDALDSAFNEIDKEERVVTKLNKMIENDPSKALNESNKTKEETQVVENVTSKPVPLYENIDILCSNNMSNNEVIGFPLGPPITMMQPPKEKPPPPPVEDAIDESTEESPLKRLNSTKRIKKEIRNKRSSFLGIEGMDDDSYLEPELKLAPRPDITTFLQEESRVEKMFYKKSLYYDSDSNLGESRDSGVELDRGHSDDRWSNKQSSPDVLSEQHSRQGSEPFTITSLTSEEDINKKESDIINTSENGSHYQNQNMIGHQLTYKLKELEQEKLNEHDHPEKNRIKSLEDQIKEQQKKEIFERCIDFYDDGHSEEVLRVERELLQLEQEELKRQRDNLLYKESQVRRANGRSLQDINMSQSFTAPLTKGPSLYSYSPQAPTKTNYSRQMSMPDLAMKQTEVPNFSALNPNNYANGPKNTAAAIKKLPPPIPPAKPNRNSEIPEREITLRNSRIPSAEYVNIEEITLRQKSTPDLSQQNNSHNQMTRHTLHALSAAPRSRLIPAADWLQPKRRSEPPQNYNYNQHWLIQEAEQRRIDQLRNNIKKQSQNTNQSNGTRSKHLPDAVIQTLTQRVQNMNINRPLPTPPTLVPLPQTPPETEKMLSVSGKKKCSHCGEELGRGAAMIIESLRLFYHLSCFQCCVCGVRLGDGRLGTDVRVRHNQLHCHNCYSSDDGVKFSCV